MSTSRRAFAIVLLPFLLLETYLAIALPPWAGTDEALHVKYEEFVRRERRLPDPFLDQAGADRHPPLYYALGALLVEGVERIAPHLPASLPLPGPFAGDFPLARRERSGDVEVSGASLLALRLFSVALSAVALLFVRRCALLVVPDAPRAAAGATAFFAFNPNFLLQSAIANNDAAAGTAGTVLACFLLRGLSRGGRFSPLLAGAVAGIGYLVKANCVVLLPIGLAAVLLRRRREGARPLQEAGLFSLGWLLLAGAWLARNVVRFGEPLGVGGVVATRGYLFFPGPKTWGLLDAVLGELLFSFWEPLPFFNAGRLARMVLGLLVAIALFGAGLRLLHPRVRAEAPDLVAPIALSLFAGICLYALVAAGALLVPSSGGRLFFPGHGFFAAILVAGVPPALRIRSDAMALPLSGGAAALAGLVFSFGLLLPLHRVPKSTWSRDTIAYLDCGHPTAEASCLRGVVLRPPYLFGWPLAAYTASVDPERVEYQIGGLDPSVPLRLEVTYASCDVTYDDRVVGNLEPDVRPLVQRMRAGDVEMHGPLTVTHLARRFSYRLPPGTIREGRLRLAFERVSGLCATVSEIRLRRDPTTVEASVEGTGRGNTSVHVRVRGEVGRGERLAAGWFSPASDPDRVLAYQVQPAKEGADLLFATRELPSGRIRFCAVLLDPEASPFASVEAETLPHPGWKVFSDPKALGRYMVRATEGWTRPGDAVSLSLVGAPPGIYLAEVRYCASGAEGSARSALGAELPESAGRYREVRTFLEAREGVLSGSVSFGGKGRLILDRLTFTAVAGPCARPDAALEFEVP